MSGQPYKYATDVDKFRNEYLQTLGLQADINQMNLEANKTYKETGQLPPVSQMKDTRTTAEILADTERLKQGLMKDFEGLGDANFRMALIQRLQSSPLNADGSLFTFVAQRAPEIALHLKKQYKYGIKGDQNDVSQFVSFIEDMYSKTKTLTNTVNSFFSRTGTTGGVITTTDLNTYKKMLLEIEKNLSLKSGKRFERTEIQTMINDVVKNIDVLRNILDEGSRVIFTEQFLSKRHSDSRFAYLQDYATEKELTEYFTEYNYIIEQLPKPEQVHVLIDQLSRSLSNKNNGLSITILNNIKSLFMFQNFKRLQELAKKMTSLVTSEQFNAAMDFERDNPSSSSSQYYERFAQPEANVEEDLNESNALAWKSFRELEKTINDMVKRGEGHTEQFKELMREYQSLGHQLELNSGNIIPVTFQSKILPGNKALEEGKDVYRDPYPTEIHDRFFPGGGGGGGPSMEQLLLLTNGGNPPVEFEERPQPSLTLGQQSSPFFIPPESKQEEMEQEQEEAKPQSIEGIEAAIARKRKEYNRTRNQEKKKVLEDEMISLNKQRKQLIERQNEAPTMTFEQFMSEPKEKEETGDLNEYSEEELEKMLEEIKTKNKKLEEKREAKENEMKKNTERLEDYSSDAPKQKEKEALRAANRRLQNEINDITGSPEMKEQRTIEQLITRKMQERPYGYGLPKRRGRPRGTGIAKPYNHSVVEHAAFDKGIESSPRFVKFGNYLVNLRKLHNEDILALKTGKGFSVQNLPSTRLSKNLSGIIKKMIGGSVLSYAEINSLSEPEKIYLHNVSKKANIQDKFTIPAPSMEKRDKDIHDFEVMKGEIMAGNDNKDLIKKFKIHILRLSKEGVLPKKEVAEIMEDLLELGI